MAKKKRKAQKSDSGENNGAINAENNDSLKPDPQLNEEEAAVDGETEPMDEPTNPEKESPPIHEQTDAHEETTAENTDEEDLQETLEVTVGNPLTDGIFAEYEERLNRLEKSIKDGASKVSDLIDSQEEAFKRISISVGDSHLAIKTSEEVQKSYRQLKESFEKMNDVIEEKLTAFREKLDETAGRLEKSDQIEKLREEFDGRINRIASVEEKIDILGENLRDEFQLKLEEMEEMQSKSADPAEIDAKMEKINESATFRFEKIEDGFVAIRAMIADNLGLLEEKFKGLKTDLTEEQQRLQGEIDRITGKKIATLQSQIESLQLQLMEMLEKIEKTGSENTAAIQQEHENRKTSEESINNKITGIQNELSGELYSSIESFALKLADMKENLAHIRQSNSTETDRLKSRIEIVAENAQMEMEVFAEEVKEELESIEANKARLDEAMGKIGVLEEKTEKNSLSIVNLTSLMEQTKDKISSIIDGKLESMENQLTLLKTGLEEELHENLSGIEKQVESLDKDFDQRLQPIRDEVESAKNFIEKEMITVRESWEKLDKTISDSEGAMSIAQRAKESLVKLDQEVGTAIARIDNLLHSVNENTIKTDSNMDKINLTIKLIDEARERIKTIQSPSTGMVTGVPSASVIPGAIELEELVLKPEEIIDDPDLGSVGFELEDLLQVMLQHKASDLHLKSGAPPTVRLEGELVPVGSSTLSTEDCKKLVLSAMSPTMRAMLAKKQEVDFAYAIPGARFRVNAFLQKQSISAAFRLLWTDIPTVEELHLPPVVKKLCAFNHGLILVTGPAGSGKSTTLSAMINYINENRKLHIITIEDPIEFIHKDKMSIITQREVGTDTESFANALKQSLRQDPNVILIGEMRDPETIMTSVIAAETGHMVLSTLHTPNTIQAINRIIDVFSGDIQNQFRLLLSNTLRGVISQRLLTRADESGRIPAIEVLLATSTISSLILEGKTNDIYQHLSQGKTEGMQTFTMSLIQLLEKGLISKEEALYHADQPTELRLAIEGHSTGSSSMAQDENLMSWL